jgi:hypothetical protein
VCVFNSHTHRLEATTVLIVIVFIAVLRKRKFKKPPVLLKSKFDKAVKMINFIKSQPWAHVVLISCVGKWEEHRTLLLCAEGEGTTIL